jgi:multidrug/hemolysin transport system permease protein
MNSLTLRHLQIFFRDKGNVFFALLSSLIMFALFLFFLGAIQAKNLQESVPGTSPDSAELFINSWVFAGIIAITAVTTSLGALTVFISDRSEGRLKDFAVSPISRWKLVFSYVASAVIISSLLTTLAVVLSQIYLVYSGSELIRSVEILPVLLFIVFISFVFSSFACLVATFVKTSAAFTSVSIIIGTSIGFLAGIYVPSGSLPTAVINVVNTLPFAQAAALSRELLAGAALNEVANQNDTLKEGLVEGYGFELLIGDATLTTPILIALLLLFAGICLALAAARMNRTLRTS